MRRSIGAIYWQAVRLARVTLNMLVEVADELGESDAAATTKTDETALDETTPVGCLVISDS